MKRRLKGVSGSVLGFGLGATWENVSGDKAAALSVLRYLEDRRLLFGLRHVEDEQHCVLSALDIRRHLTDQLTTGNIGPSLTHCLTMMRAACRNFVTAGGPDAQHFQSRYGAPGVDRFSVALGELRALMGQQIGLLATQYNIPIEDELAAIVIWPVAEDADPSWLPGFTQPEEA